MEVVKIYLQGNSTVLAIPKTVRELLGLERGDKLVIMVDEENTKFTAQKINIEKVLERGGDNGKN